MVLSRSQKEGEIVEQYSTDPKFLSRTMAMQILMRWLVTLKFGMKEDKVHEKYQEHDRRLKHVLEKAREYISKTPKSVKPTNQKKTHMLVTDSGIKLDPPKNKKLLRWWKNFVKDLQIFMGFISQINEPLRILFEEKTAWHWGKEQKRSFQTLKERALYAPVLP